MFKIFLLFFFIITINAYSQYQFNSIEHKKYIVQGLKNLVTEPTHNNYNYCDTIIIKGNTYLPKQHFGRFVGQYFAGLGIGTGFAAAILIPSVLLDKRAFDVGGGHSNGVSTVGFFVSIAAFITGNIVGVWSAGNTGGFSADATMTAVGGIVGVPVGIATGLGLYRLNEKYNNDNGWGIFGAIIIGASMIPIGSIIGFNSTRSYDEIKYNKKSLINYKHNYFTFSIPEVVIETDKSFKRNPISLLKIVRINF
jgi:hypothetical protein